MDSIGVELKSGVSTVVVDRIECAHRRSSSTVDVVEFDLKIVLAVGIDAIDIEVCYGGVRQLVVARPGSHCGTCTVKANPVVATNNLAGVNSEVRCRVVVGAGWRRCACSQRNSNVVIEGCQRLVRLDNASLEGIKVGIVV